YNEEHPQQRIDVIRYDDFNPFLDHFCERMSRRQAKKPEKVLDAWRLWDHMDAILCIGVTDVVDRVLGLGKQSPSQAIDSASLQALNRTEARDLLLLAACYDQSTSDSFPTRWNNLRRRLRYSNLAAKWRLPVAIGWGLLSVVFVFWVMFGSAGGGEAVEQAAAQAAESEQGGVNWLLLWLIPILVLIGALPYLVQWIKCQAAALGIRKHMRVGKREVSSLRQVLQLIPAKELASQPLPRYDRTDDRYELLNKFQSVLQRLGFAGVIVLMDRVDEPHMTGGKPELMRRFVWPMLDNKLLKHPGLGFKMMLPQELHRDLERETREFHERARMDKQNVIPAFQWTGESLYDLARARMMACAADGRSPEPQEIFEEAISYERLLSAFQTLRVPRHLFRFLYRVLVEHCNRHTDAQPVFRIKTETFESVLAVYYRETDIQSI
ncbi:MAG: hypothetical protein MI861_27375, partial [Pirellulales bacterium]|nr:hypothetical protein [Pirellulales bacterium]